jgi:hypothetical protein
VRQFVQGALSLSRPHPITLHADFTLIRGHVSVGALCHALAHINRIRKIRILSPWGTKHGDHFVSIMCGVLLCGAPPALEEFDLD